MVGVTEETALLRWIPLLPLLTAAVHGVMLGVLRRSLPREGVIALSCGSVILSFVLSLVAFFRLLGLPEGGALVDDLYTWIGAGHFAAEMGLRVDALSAVMILVVTGVGSLIHVYSIGYMDEDHREDRGFQRFFCYLNLFTFSMLMLVLGENLVVLFLGWEGVGLCSYLLIGFWYADRFNAYCGAKAFIVNRVGDFGFLLGIFLLFRALLEAGTPTLSFAGMEAAFGAIAEQTVQLPAWIPGPSEWRLPTLIGLCLFIGACGKSAQIPLYVWLPDAMAGPTPVSALIHAATMVTAGVYMVCRMDFLYAAAPGASATVAWIGGATALFAATIAIAQTDIKKVLAYSTVSQLGYMFLAAGSGAYTAAMFHLGTHAFFKALLFLGSGSVILACHHEQDIRKMGGLKERIPRTERLFWIGVLAISGIPPLAGFFSKDQILAAAFASHLPGHLVLYGMGLFTAALTAFYMGRLHYLTFHGECRLDPAQRDHVHERGPTIRVALYVLAFFSATAGLFGFPEALGVPLGVEHPHSLWNFLAPVLSEERHHLDHATEYGMMAAAVGIAVGGLLLARALYREPSDLPARIAERAGALYRLIRDKYYVDEIYDAVIVRPLVFVSDRVLYRQVDAGLIDGLGVNGTARAVRLAAAHVLRHAHSGLAQGYLFFLVVGTLVILGYLVG